METFDTTSLLVLPKAWGLMYYTRRLWSVWLTTCPNRQLIELTKRMLV